MSSETQGECTGAQCAETLVREGPYPSLPSGEDTVEVKAYDAVGLSASVVSPKIKVDWTPPYAIKLVGLPANGILSEAEYHLTASATDGSGSVESSGVGAWTQLDWRTFGYTNVAVISDLNGNLVGFFKVRGVYQLDKSGDSYTGHSYYEFLDTDHKPTNKPLPPG